MLDLFENWCRLERENIHGQIKKSQFRADVDEWCGRHKDRFVVKFDRDWRYTQYEIVYMTGTWFCGLESYGSKPPLASTKYSQPYHQIEDPTNEGYFLRRAITKKFRHQVIDLSHQAQLQSPAQNPTPQPQP